MLCTKCITRGFFKTSDTVFAIMPFLNLFFADDKSLRYGIPNEANHHQGMGNQIVYNWQRHANTVPQTHRGGRRLPQTPNIPSTLSKTNPPHFAAIDPRHNMR